MAICRRDWQMIWMTGLVLMSILPALYAANPPADAFKGLGGHITALARDINGNFWLGAEDKGVFMIDPHRDEKAKHFGAANGLGDDNAYAMACDTQGRLWVGHLRHGISVYNGKEWRNYDVESGPLGERVFDIAVSPRNGDVWIASSLGLARYSPEGEWRYYTRAHGLPSDQIQSVAVSGDGTVYAGTQCNGLAEVSVKDGRITLPSGMNYRLLVFRKSDTMTPELARKVRELVKAGALVLGAKPRRSPSLVGYPDCDAELRKMADEVWGNVDGKRVKQHAFGRGRVYHGLSIEAVLNADGLAPDMQWSHGALDWEHRQIEGGDFYFVANHEAESVATELSLKINGKVPEFWYPDTGKIETCGLWRNENGRTLIPLELDPYGSLFIVFRKPGRPHVTDLKGDGATVRIANGKPQLVAAKNGSFAVTTAAVTKTIKVSTLAKPHTINGPWQVSFPPKLGAPESAVFKKLISLTEHADEGIKYFSGTASYTCDFKVPTGMIGKNKRVSIDLGRLEAIAELFVNGKSAGTLWKPPFKTDITALVRAGKNRLEVRVTNPWRNRLIGDEQKPQKMAWRNQGNKGFVLTKWPEWLLKGQPKPEGGRITFAT